MRVDPAAHRVIIKHLKKLNVEDGKIGSIISGLPNTYRGLIDKTREFLGLPSDVLADETGKLRFAGVDDVLKYVESLI